MKVKAGIQESYTTSRTPAFSLLSFFSYLQFGNFHVGFVTAAVSTIPALLSHAAINFESQLFILCSTIFIYNFDHSRISKADEINAPGRCRWIRENKKVLLLTNLSCLACCIGLLLKKGELFSLASALALLLICVLYSRSQFLKKIPGMKSMIISMVWSFTCILLPVIWDQLPLESSTIIKLGFFCGGIAFVNSLFFDRRDLLGDLELGVNSLPALLGQKRTSQAIISLSGSLLLIGLFEKTLMGFSLIALCYILIEISHERFQKNTLLIDGLLLLALLGCWDFRFWL